MASRRQVEPARRFRERADIHHRHEALEKSDIHAVMLTNPMALKGAPLGVP